MKLDDIGVLYDLGIEYHDSMEVNKGGVRGIRFVLSKPLTQEQVEALGQYDNVEYHKNGAQSKYAPEQKYDTLILTGIDEEEEEAYESMFPEDPVDPPAEFDDQDHSEELLKQLDQEIGNEITPSPLSLINSAIATLNSQLITYGELAKGLPQAKELIASLVSETGTQIGKLISLQGETALGGEIKKGMSEAEGQVLPTSMDQVVVTTTTATEAEDNDLYQQITQEDDADPNGNPGPRTRNLIKQVIAAIEASPILSQDEEYLEEAKEELSYLEDIKELMGLEEMDGAGNCKPTPEFYEAYSSDPNRVKACIGRYVQELEKIYQEEAED